MSTNDQLSNYVFGKVQPQNLKLEEVVIGAMLIDKDAVTVCRGVLTDSSDFYAKAHQVIYEAILALDDKMRPVDLLTVTEQLRAAGRLDDVGGAAYLVDLTNKVASAANVEYHAFILKQKAILRAAIRAGSAVIQAAHDTSLDDLEILDIIEREFFSLIRSTGGANSLEVARVVDEISKHQLEMIKSNRQVSGIRSGFADLDKITNGFQPGKVYVLAGRPGMGKSSLITSMVHRMRKYDDPVVALFTLEMSAIEQTNRLISIESGLSYDKVINPNLRSQGENDAYEAARERVSDYNLIINDQAGISVESLRTEVRQLVAKYNVEIVFIDYLQLMTSSGKYSSREERVTEISKMLAVLSKECEVPVVELSQLSRSVEQRGGDKRPQLSDLRESGSIEQDASFVGFLYRPYYYGIKEDEFGNSTMNLCELIVAKNRNGKLVDLSLAFDFQTSSFSDWQGNEDFSKFVIENSESDDGSMPF
jgi:replicative DNA helicase